MISRVASPADNHIYDRLASPGGALHRRQTTAPLASKNSLRD